MTNNEEDFEVCMRAENVILPKMGYFGVTAATGGLAGKDINCCNYF
jgi:mannose-binding lectin 1